MGRLRLGLESVAEVRPGRCETPEKPSLLKWVPSSHTAGQSSCGSGCLLSKGQEVIQALNSDMTATLGLAGAVFTQHLGSLGIQSGKLQGERRRKREDGEEGVTEDILSTPALLLEVQDPISLLLPRN